MAPDLNSVPPSPRPRGPSVTAMASAAVGGAGAGAGAGSGALAEPQHHHPHRPPSASPSLSRRVSQNLSMGPPQTPHAGVGLGVGAGDNTGVGTGPGPLRHPRPITIADLHLELEKEQEAVVNRLTRELTLLRQQTASVASTASSNSTNLNDYGDLHMLSGTSQPPTGRHRSSSTLSSRSLATSHVGAAAASAVGPRPILDPSHHRSFSREISASSPQHGMAALSLSPSVSQQQQQQHGENIHSGPTLSPHGPSRYEEVAQHRAELEAVKRENELLRRRVRDLESMIRQHRQSRDRAEGGSAVSTVPGPGGGLRDADAADGQEA